MRWQLAFALALVLSATGAWADRYEDCVQSAGLERKIRGCTQVIERGRRESRGNRVVAYTNRGNAHHGKREHDRAIADYNKALKLNPKHAVAYNNRGLAYEKKGEADRAIADYNKAIKINSNYAHAYYNRGNAYYDKAQYDRAIADYDTAIALNPNHAHFYYNRGATYINNSDRERAIADFREALEIDPSNELAKNRLEQLGVRPISAASIETGKTIQGIGSETEPEPKDDPRNVGCKKYIAAVGMTLTVPCQ